MSVLNDPDLERLLAAVHAESDAQVAAMELWYAERARQSPPPTAEEVKQFRGDKLVALDRDKAEFCYQLCRAIDARRIVEAGTSHGVSTLYLAAAVRDNIRAAGGANMGGANMGGANTSGGDGVVIGTEYEPAKAAIARRHFEQMGLSRFIDLREGDLRETLRHIDGPVDFLLVDIWVPMARPALELVTPRLRPGAMVVCDNTARHRAAYADYFAFLATGFRTMTLPFGGGLELSVRCPP